MSSSRDALVSAAQLSIAQGSKSFTFASQLFDRRTRERAWLLYFWCRACDDIVDGQEFGGELRPIDDIGERVARVRALTERALAGETTGAQPFDALALVVAECGIPHQLPHDVIDGFLLDAQEWRPRSEDDLLRYCYHVAGAVGRMMALIMGVRVEDVDTLDRATDLGIAFQLANVARDLLEDDRAGRCYVPDEWLAEIDMLPGEHMRPNFRSRLALIGKWYADLAEEYEASARVGAARLPFRSRWAVLAAAGIYGDIARDVRARGAHAWDTRVTTSKRQKLRNVGEALRRATRRGPTGGREALWTYRPQVG